jgi:non-specific serine/threonine protein kinase
VEPFTLALTPAGHLFVRPGDPPDALPPALAGRVLAAFARGAGPGLLQLCAGEPHASLPAAFAFWRSLGRAFVSALCAVPELEALRARAAPEPPQGELARLAASAPPLAGGEYLTPAVLGALWGELLQAWRAELAGAPGTVQEWLAARDPAWGLVGRVHLHLAENRRDPERPFAFLATYTTGLAPNGKPQHRALRDAVREAASIGPSASPRRPASAGSPPPAADRRRLLALLEPVQRAAERSPLVKALADSGALFEPQAWTPEEAHRFLREAPALAESGVVVRVPEWWSGQRAPRPRVTVRVGEGAPAALGLDALLDFDVRLTLDGEEVTEAELHALRARHGELVLFKGRWVEVDGEKLDALLSRWRAAQRSAGEGISFVEAMRLLAGADLPSGSGEAALPLDLEWTGVRPGAWLSRTLAALRGEGAAAAADPGDALRATLRPYQRDGVRWLWTLTRLGLGGCLADDMGLGKTVQVLALLLALKRARSLPGPHLLVAPASLLANWKAEATRFAPSLRVLVAHPSAAPREALAALGPAALEDQDLVVVSYAGARRLEWLARTPFGLVVLDEAQAVKNPNAAQTRAVKALRGRVRLALTGTPVENRPGDLWSIFDFLNPGLLGSARAFGAWLRRAGQAAAAPPDGAPPASPYGPVRALIRPYLLRRLKTDPAVIQDLPAKTEVKAWCSLTRRQAALYAEAVEGLAREVKELREGSPADRMRRRGVVLSYLLRLKQICNHPSQWLEDGAYAPEDSGKFARLAELAEVIGSRQEKALVFTQFRELTAPLARHLERLFGRPGLVLHGATRVKDRAEVVRRFQEDEAVPFLVLSLKAGGTGLNLTAATHVVHFDRWWNPAVEDQATDRAFRIGQVRGVLVHKLVCRGTVEERIDAMLEDKARLSRELLEGQKELRLSELGDDELLRLVALDLESATQAA